MAYSVITTKIPNPAKGKRKMKFNPRKLTAKQIRAGFGGKRRQLALRGKHRAATKPKSNPPKKKRAKTAKSARPRTKPRHTKAAKNRAPKHYKAKTKSNPTPEIISFVMGNPAKKGKKKQSMAKHYKKKSASKSNAGARHHKSRSKPKGNPGRKHRGRNPAGVPTMKLVKGAGFALASGIATRAIPQFAGASNTGPMGYVMNAGTAIAAMIATHMISKDPWMTFASGIGGIMALIMRVWNDQTPAGITLSLSGFGDYMVSNWVTPQRIINPNSAMWEIPSGWGTMPAALPPAGMSMQSGADARTSGNSY